MASKIPFVINDFPTIPHPSLREIMYRTVFRSRKDMSLNRFVSENNPHPINLIRLPPDTSQRLYLTHQEYFRMRKNVAIWAWNFPKFPPEWALWFRPYREIWAVSNFTREALSKCSPVPVRTMTNPLAIDRSSLNTLYARRRLGLDEKSCVFLFACMFHFDGGFQRKNPLAVLEAFGRAFSKADDAVLVVKTTPTSPLSVARNLKTYVIAYRELMKLAKAKSRRMIMIEEQLSRTSFLSLVSSCDSFVSLHRAEGFGQILAEAMYLGKPVIATAYSGNLDFMNDGNSLLVKRNLVPMARNFETFGPRSETYTWAEPDVDHAAELMRWVYDNREEARHMGKKASEEVARLMNPNRVGKEIREKCENIMHN